MMLADTAFAADFQGLFGSFLQTSILLMVLAYRLGWRSVVRGLPVGVGAGVMWQILVPMPEAMFLPDLLRGILLVGLGGVLLYLFIGGLALRDEGGIVPMAPSMGWDKPIGPMSVILIVWATGLDIAAQASPTDIVSTPALTVLAFQATLWWLLARTRLAAHLPGYAADGISAFLCIALGTSALLPG